MKTPTDVTNTEALRRRGAKPNPDAIKVTLPEPEVNFNGKQEYHLDSGEIIVQAKSRDNGWFIIGVKQTPQELLFKIVGGRKRSMRYFETAEKAAEAIARGSIGKGT